MQNGRPFSSILYGTIYQVDVVELSNHHGERE